MIVKRMVEKYVNRWYMMVSRRHLGPMLEPEAKGRRASLRGRDQPRELGELLERVDPSGMVVHLVRPTTRIAVRLDSVASCFQDQAFPIVPELVPLR